MDSSRGSATLDLAALSSQSYDPVQQLWNILPDDPDPQLISRLLSQAQLHHNQLTQQMYAKVIAQHEAMVVLRDARALATKGRDEVKEAKADLATGGLKVLALNKRREQHLLLAKNIQNIKRVMTMKATIQEKIQEGDFLKALSLCSECQHLVSECKDFSCLSGMTQAIKTQNNEIISLLGVALADACRTPFNQALYQKTIAAFQLTRKPSRVVSRVNKQFSKFVTTATMRSLSSHVMTDPDNLENAEAIKQMKFRDLLKLLKESSFLSCFTMIVSQMCDIMYTLHQMIQFHEDRPADVSATELAYGKEIAEGLKGSTKVLWDEMQRLITMMCQTETLLAFKASNFISILDGLNTFVNIGEQFSHEPAHKLRGIIKTVSKGFYDEFHANAVETIRHQLSEESWHRLPVNSRFNPRDIGELNDVLTRHFPSGQANTSLEAKIAVKGNKFFELYPTQGNPFSSGAIAKSEKEASILTNTKNSEIDKELLRDALTKILAQYIEMMKVLNHISWDVCQGLLFISSTYAHTVLGFFSPALNIPGISHIPTSMFFFTVPESSYKENIRLAKATLRDSQTQVDVSQNAMHGLLPLSVAAESLSFLHETLKLLKPFIQSLLPKAHIQTFLQSSLASIDSLPEVRLLMYKALCHKIFPTEIFLQSISSVNWNCNEQPAATPSYVHHVANSLEAFKKRFDKFIETQGQVLPYRVSKQVWESLMSHVCDSLVEGFSVSPCSPMGRAMMGIGFQSIQQAMEELAEFKPPVPALRYVDTYIKAYFQAAEDLETWLKDHSEYSHKQATALVSCADWTPEVKRKCLRTLGPAPVK